jgi:hypothetical protein
MSIQIAYYNSNPTDFLWSNYNIPQTCDSNITCVPANCNPNSYNGGSVSGCIPCVQKELCRNKTLSQTITSRQNNYSGSDARYADISNEYSTLYRDNIHLKIGIITLLMIGSYFMWE